MKRIAIVVIMALMTLTASATSIRYFTYPQASRTVQYLNAQQEMMIYCGYDYEIETYVLINEVWMERVNSAYYEIWVYGYDAYTGDEIYMPLDLQCVWLYSAGRMYNAAQYLRFHASVRMPSFKWYVPHYNPYTRRMHMAGYMRSYHYDIHRHGWMPPTPPQHGWGPHTQPPLPPYYMRTPQTPAPTPSGNWTPGLEHPQVNNSGSGNGPRSTGVVPSTRPANGGGTTSGNSGSARSGNSRSTDNGSASTTRSGEDRNTGSARSTGTPTTTRTGTTPTRTNTGTTTNTRTDGGRSTGTPTTTSSTSSSRSGSTGTTTNTRTNGGRSTGTPTTTGSTGSSRSGSTGTTTSTSTSRSGSTGTTTSTSTSRSGNARSSETTTNSRSTTTTSSRSTSSTTTRR